MPLLFSRLCDLFSDLEEFFEHDSPLLLAPLRQRVRERIIQWFGSLNLHGPATDIDRAALLSAILPKKRKDRVYNLKPESLSKKLRRVLCLGSGRWELLDRWKEPGRGDLGQCVLRALREAEHPLLCATKQVTVEEVDRVLAGIAKGVRFSAPSVRNGSTKELKVDEGLQRIYRRLQSREAKWFTRMILQDYAPIDIPEAVVYRCIDPQLPMILKLYDHFEDAIKSLENLGASKRECTLKPQIGVKVGRPSYRPARSIKHAVQTVSNRKMSVERKYDGEYCQVHIDLQAPGNPIQLFSKSGKDSTSDRAGLHKTINDCLGLGGEECLISSKCILEGEMVVWSDRENRILDFCKIRKHVSRTGSFLGTASDSQPHPWEHLMIVFYDVILLDEHSLLPMPHVERRKLLEQLVSPIHGRADLVVQRVLDFSHPKAPKDLQKHFAQAIAKRWEGLVLKPSDEPYFGPAQPIPNTYPSCWLKMKKDYITGLGDTADFAVVGAGYDVQEASKRGDKTLNWTHFHIGCLKNKSAVVHLRAKPEYAVIDAVTQSISAKDIAYLNQHGQFRALEVGSSECISSFAFEMTSELAARMTVAFKKPFVFEVMGGGFDKPPNTEIYRLRWPRVLKIHQDRDWKNAVTLKELQMMAADALATPLEDDLPEEVETWQERLDAVDRGTRKAALPWDDSQYEESDDDEDTERAAQPIRNAPRSRRLVGPPLVRMDSVEMDAGEQRLPSGDVTRRPISRGSVFSRASSSLLPTPPTSSPGGEEAVFCSKSSPVSTSPTARKKRKSETVLIDDSPPRSKRLRSQGEFSVEPLRETINASNRSRPFASAEQISNEPEKSSKVEPFLVRKIPVMTDARFLPKSRRKPWKPIIDPSSNNSETTASEASTQTTHITSIPQTTTSTMSIAGNGPQPRQHGATLVTAQSEEESTLIEIPDLLHSRVMLSPCVSNDLQILDKYFSGRINNIIPLPTVATTTSPFPPTPPPSNSSATDEVILLIEPANVEVSGYLLSTLVPHIPTCGYRISFWNWEILKASPNTLIPERLYIGTMSYDAVENEVLTAWRDNKEWRTRLHDLVLPDLMQHPVMLSRCVSRNARILEEHLPGQVDDILPFPSPGVTPRPPPLDATPAQKQIILLIEPKNNDASGKVMDTILRWLPWSGYQRVEIWHWKLLKLAKQGVRDGRKVQKCFTASMRVSEEKQRNGEWCEVRTVWRAGQVTRVDVGRNGEVDVIAEVLL